MKLLNKNLVPNKRILIKVFVLVVCFIIFVNWYFLPAYDSYARALTNTATFVDQIEDIQPPVITVCFEPHFKQSVYDKYNITEDIFFENSHPNVMAYKTIKVT